MKPIVKSLIVIGTLSIANGVNADDSNSPVQSAIQTPVSDQEFAWEASIANLKEIHLAQFAQQNSTNEDVQMYAKHMVHDHAVANRKLSKIAVAEGLNLPDANAFDIVVNIDQPQKQATQLTEHETPESKLKDQQMAAEQIESLSGRAFDQAYADAMVKDHADAVQLFENAADSITNEDLKHFAVKTLSTLRHHYEMAQSLQNNVDGIQSTNGQGVTQETNTLAPGTSM